MALDFRLRWLMRFRHFAHNENQINSMPLESCVSPYFIIPSMLLGGFGVYGVLLAYPSNAGLASLTMLAVPLTLHFGYAIALRCLHKGIVRPDNQLAWKIANDDATFYELKTLVKSKVSEEQSVDYRSIRISLPWCCSSGKYTLRELANAANATKVNQELDCINIYFGDHCYPFFAVLYKLEQRKQYSGKKSLLQLPNDVTKLLLDFLDIKDIIKVPQIITDKYAVLLTIELKYVERFSTSDKLLSAYEEYRKKLNAAINNKVKSQEDIHFDLEAQSISSISTERTPLLRNLGVV